MINYIIATKDELELLMQSRLVMLRVVNNLPDDYQFSKELTEHSKEYFQRGNQTTVLAMEGKVIGCATICYMDMMPTFSHMTGKRAHLMNVYTSNEYRRRGIAYQMITMLIDEARTKGVTEISLDATMMGKPLYEKCGFVASKECMVLTIDH